MFHICSNKASLPAPVRARMVSISSEASSLPGTTHHYEQVAIDNDIPKSISSPTKLFKKLQPCLHHHYEMQELNMTAEVIIDTSSTDGNQSVEYNALVHKSNKEDLAGNTNYK